MTNELTLGGQEERAERRVSRFVERFEPIYYELICHAALPLVLTPELVSYLRNEFLREVPWIAEVDLLLSDLCSQVGYELYVMDMDVRAYVLKQGSATFDQVRMREVANLLISYVRYLANNSGQMSNQELESQQWAAMVYLGPSERDTVVTEIVERFRSSGGGGEQVGGDLLSRAEMARLAQITDRLKDQLMDYPGLIEYASLVSDVQLHNRVIAAERVEKTYEVAPGQLLQLPSAWQQELVVKNRLRQPVRPGSVTQSVEEETELLTDSQQTQTQGLESLAELPAFQTLEFMTAQIVDPTVEADKAIDDERWPALQQEMVTVAEIRLEPVEDGLETFEYRGGRLEKRESGNQISKLFSTFSRLLPGQRQLGEWVVVRSKRQGKQWVERLTDDVFLEMVALAGGTFTMGSPSREIDRQDREGPQHQVSVPGFWMGKYAVTQAQWRFVVGLPEVNVTLSPAPSKFKGKDRPVERVSWYEAVEFCERLSVHTGRNYRLPTEAEWEYACRGGTKTPFHVGETITADIVNYDANYTYGEGPKGIYRKETITVGQLGIANDFGLYDMHGNVWEWCQDHWHKDYTNAPTDGSAWLTQDKNANRVNRGGSWYYFPRDCRSASRLLNLPSIRFNFIGFRVSCSPPGL